jgi:hypothetical protein
MKIVCSITALLLSVSLYAQSYYETARQEVRVVMEQHFKALNAGKMTLSEVGELAFSLAESSDSELKRRILFDGAARLFERAGNTNRAETAKERLEAMSKHFIISGNQAFLRLGKYGKLEFVRCPTGTVDLAVHWRNGKTVPVTLTKPYWIMKYPITRRQSMLYPPLDPPPNAVNEAHFNSYVCLNRSQTDGLCEYFTKYFKDALPKGYVIRLPTLAEWEHAYHANEKDPASPFFDLLRIHVNGEVDRAVRYDYDRNQPQRTKAVNAWGIGDWCGQEKVFDLVNPAELVKSKSDGDDSFQVQELPPFKTLVDPCFAYDGSNRVSLIRMPFWARWKASSMGYGQDWCPIRLVIAPDTAKPKTDTY